MTQKEKERMARKKQKQTLKQQEKDTRLCERLEKDKGFRGEN